MASMLGPFHFKHFSLLHHRATMKVGTDAVLLGSWAGIDNVRYFLDAGTGSGILALMAAQRNQSAIIHAIDIDGDSVEEATANFLRSPWSDRIYSSHADLRTYEPEQDIHYDLICSNPPFFEHHLRTRNTRRNLARHTDTLTFKDLLASCNRLLAPNGSIAIVLPWQVGKQVLSMAPSFDLWPARIQYIIPVEGRESNRMNLELRKNPDIKPVVSSFIIRKADMRFTEEYDELLKDFYLGIGK